MTNVIRITKGGGGSPDGGANYDGLTYTALSFLELTDDLQMPVTHFALPEDEAKNAHLLKIEGNTNSLTLSWLIANHNFDHASGSGGQAGFPNGVRTMLEQKEYLKKVFEHIHLGDGDDTIEVMEVISTTGALQSLTPEQKYKGTIVAIVTTVNSDNPDLCRVTLSMLIGDSLSEASEVERTTSEE